MGGEDGDGGWVGGEDGDDGWAGGDGGWVGGRVVMVSGEDGEMYYFC